MEEKNNEKIDGKLIFEIKREILDKFGIEF